MKEDKPKLPIVSPDARYEVGYGKPPEASRFKPGRSGNPKGRPRGSKNKRISLPKKPPFSCREYQETNFLLKQQKNWNNLAFLGS